jgi:Flp pilus assembly protein TadD
MRAAIVADASLAPQLASIDAALKNDAEAIAVGSRVLANAAIPPAPTVAAMDVPAASSPASGPALGAAPVSASGSVVAERAVVAPRPVVAMSRARRAALDSAAAQNRRALATSIDVTAPTRGLEEIGARVLTVRTFESGAPLVPFGARRYARTFETGATRYLYTEVSVGFTSEATTPAVQLSCWTARDDSVLTRQSVQVSHASDASIYLFAVGIGWGEPNRLEPGRYVTGCDHDDVPVLADSFMVTGVTARSAYVAAEVSADASDWNAAAAAYDTATRLDSTVAQYHSGYGAALERLHRDSAAVEEYTTAIRLAPNELRYHAQLAELLHHLQRFDDAAAEYRGIIRMDSTDARWHAALASLLEESGNRVGALAEYREAAALDASEPYYRQRIAALTQRN